MSYSVTNAYHAQTADASRAVRELRSITCMATVRTGLKNQQAAEMFPHAIAARIGRE
jgi:hypothetical protein